MKRSTILLSPAFALAACAKADAPATEAPATEAPAAAQEAAPGEAAATETPAGGETAATQPDSGKLATHAKEHIKYPATRAAILEACAQSPEFSEAEKKWLADHLAEGTYESSDQLTKALGI